MSEAKSEGEAEMKARTEARSKSFDKRESFDKPVIAAVNGYALGGGLKWQFHATLDSQLKNANFVLRS